MKEKDIVLQSRQAIPVHPELIRMLGGDHVGAIYFEQLLYYDKHEPKDDDGYFPKSKVTIERDTVLTRFQQDRARDKLERLGWITVRIEPFRGSQTVCFKVLRDISIPGKRV